MLLNNKYDILRNRRNGLAIVNVLDGVCQGCFMNLPPQQYNMLLRGDKLLDCPSCQRMIYYQTGLKTSKMFSLSSFYQKNYINSRSGCMIAPVF